MCTCSVVPLCRCCYIWNLYLLTFLWTVLCNCSHGYNAVIRQFGFTHTLVIIPVYSRTSFTLFIRAGRQEAERLPSAETPRRPRRSAGRSGSIPPLQSGSWNRERKQHVTNHEFHHRFELLGQKQSEERPARRILFIQRNTDFFI